MRRMDKIVGIAAISVFLITLCGMIALGVRAAFNRKKRFRRY